MPQPAVENKKTEPAPSAQSQEALGVLEVVVAVALVDVDLGRDDLAGFDRRAVVDGHHADVVVGGQLGPARGRLGGLDARGRREQR